MADDADRVVTIDLQVATDLSGSDVVIQPRDGTAPLRFPAEDLASAAVADLNLDGTSSTDGTLTGDGSDASPLSVAEPYSASERNKLAGIEAGAEANTNEDWADVGNTDPIPRAKLTEASGVGLNQSEVDARVEVGVADWAEAGDTSQIPANKLANAPSGGGGGGLSTSEVDARVRAIAEDFAEVGNATQVPDSKIPSTIARDSEVPSNAAIDARADARVRSGVENWAETGNAATIPEAKIPPAIARDSEVPATVRSLVEDFAETGNATQIPDSKIPSTIARDSEIPDVSGFQTQAQVDVRVQAGVSDWAEAGNADQIPLNKLGNAPSGGGGGGLTTEQARSLIADWAEEGNAQSIPESKIPASIARDTEIPDVSSFQNQTQVDARVRSIVEDWAETSNPTLIPDAKIPTGIARDSEVENFARVGNPAQIPDSKIPTGIARDAEVENFASVGNPAQVPDSKIPSSIARDSELPDISGLQTQAQVDARVRAGVEDWAEQGNATTIPDGKIPSAITRDSELPAAVSTGVADWAETGNTDQIPLNKLGNAPSGGGGGGSSTFVGLTDTPSTLGTAGQAVIVNPDGTALTFGDAASGGGGGGGLEVLGGPTNIDLLSDSDGNALWFDTGITLTDDHEVYVVSLGRLEIVNGPSFVLDAPTLRGCVPQVAGTRIISAASSAAADRQRMIVSDDAYFNTTFSFGRTAANNLLIGSSDDFHDPLPFRLIGIAPGGGGSGGGASDFTDLGDTPDALGTAGQVPIVNADGDAFVFADAATGDLAELSKELFGNFDDLLASASMSFNAGNAASDVGTAWRTVTTGDLVTLTNPQYNTGESIQGAARFRIDSFSFEPFEYRIRFLNGTARIGTLHFSDEEATRGDSKDFDVPLASTNNILLYRYEVQVRTSGTVAGQVFFASVRLHHGDGAASAAIRAEVSRDTASLREDVAADWAQADNTDPIPADKLTNAPDATLDTAAVDARIADWAETGDTSTIPDAKIPAGIARDSEIPSTAFIASTADARVRAGVQSWAEFGNNDPVPTAKLGNQRFTATDETKLDGIETGAQRNVGVEFTTAASNKLTGIESGATGDQSGQEIVTAINTQLSGTTWQSGGGEGGGGGGGFVTRELAAATVNFTQANILTNTGITEAEWNQTDYLVLEYGGASASAVSVGGTHTVRTARLSELGDATVGSNPRQATSPSMFLGFGVQASGSGTGGYIFIAHDASGNLLMAVAATDQDQHQLVLRGYDEGSGGSGGGLTEDEVDERVAEGVADWAEEGSLALIPDAKIPAGIARDSEVPSTSEIAVVADARVRAGVEDWAEAGNTTDIPSTKLGNQRFSVADQNKLDGIEAGATGDQSGTEIVSTINAQLGGTTWQGGGGGGGSASSFEDLTDTPDSLGTAGQVPVVNADGDALVFAPGTAGWAETGNVDQIPLNKLGNAPTITGVSFQDLTNTPIHLGQRGTTLVVNATGDGLEFVNSAFDTDSSLDSARVGRASTDQRRILSVNSEEVSNRILGAPIALNPAPDRATGSLSRWTSPATGNEWVRYPGGTSYADGNAAITFLGNSRGEVTGRLTWSPASGTPDGVRFAAFISVSEADLELTDRGRLAIGEPVARIYLPATGGSTLFSLLQEPTGSSRYLYLIPEFRGAGRFSGTWTPANVAKFTTDGGAGNVASQYLLSRDIEDLVKRTNDELARCYSGVTAPSDGVLRFQHALNEDVTDVTIDMSLDSLSDVVATSERVDDNVLTVVGGGTSFALRAVPRSFGDLSDVITPSSPNGTPLVVRGTGAQASTAPSLGLTDIQWLDVDIANKGVEHAYIAAQPRADGNLFQYTTRGVLDSYMGSVALLSNNGNVGESREMRNSTLAIQGVLTDNVGTTAPTTGSSGLARITFPTENFNLLGSCGARGDLIEWRDFFTGTVQLAGSVSSYSVNGGNSDAYFNEEPTIETLSVSSDGVFSGNVVGRTTARRGPNDGNNSVFAVVIVHLYRSI